MAKIHRWLNLSDNANRGEIDRAYHDLRQQMDYAGETERREELDRLYMLVKVSEYIDKGDIATAKHCLEQMTVKDAEYYYQLGRAYKHKDFVVEARKCFFRATELEPEDVQYRRAYEEITAQAERDFNPKKGKHRQDAESVDKVGDGLLSACMSSYCCCEMSSCCCESCADSSCSCN